MTRTIFENIALAAIMALTCIPAGAQGGGFIHQPDSADLVPMEDLDSGRALDPSVSVLDKYPTPRYQGDIGSCVAWAVVHAWLIQKAHEQRFLNSVAKINAINLSASYLYNQAIFKTDDCSSGALIPRVLALAKQRGICPAGIFPNSTTNCRPSPGSKHHKAARGYRIDAYFSIIKSTDSPENRLLAVKNRLSLQVPVIVGMSVSPNFSKIAEGDIWWYPDKIDPDAKAGHAFVAVGYDDTDNGGAITLMGSFGKGWGKDGFIKMRYSDFQQMLLEAYTMYLP